MAVETPLTYRRPLRAKEVAGAAWAMLRQHFTRVSATALLFYGPGALISHIARDYFSDVTEDAGAGRIVTATVVAIVGVVVATFGPVMFGGFLEAAVGAEYYGHGRHSIGEVLRNLPWWRLVWANILVAALVSLGMALLIVPGLIAATLLSLTGPLISMLGLRSVAALRYSARLARPHFGKVFLLVVVPLSLEHAVAEEVHHVLDDAPIMLDVAGTWFVAATILGFVGLMEVAIAFTLVERAERSRAVGERGAPVQP